MQGQESPTEKLYFSISEVAQEFGVNASLLRYWETEFTQLKIRKDRSGNRLYTKADKVVLHSIFELVKEKGFTIDGAKAQLGSAKQTVKKNEAIESLKKVKFGLENLLKKL